jgi:hypothetical protein
MDRYQNKTDDGRTIISTTGLEDSIIARSSSETWQFWKFLETLSPNEISFLITNRRNKLKYMSDPDEIKSLRNDIVLLEDAYRINKRRFDLKKSERRICNLRPTSIKSYGSNILNILGFNYNSYFKQELYNMTEVFINNKHDDTVYLLKKWSKGINLNDELFATLIVKEILNHYRTEYSDSKLLEIYSIDDKELYKAYIDFHMWCSKKYWIS